MKNKLFAKALPHIIAILIFLIVSVLFCRPALEGNVLGQDDIVGWKGIAQNAFDYKAAHGEFPLWNPNVFSGMPNFLIVMNGKSILPDLNAVFALGLPQPINFFFIACICFYILCLALGTRPIVGIVAALAFAFSTYNPVIIATGHITKMYALCYTPLLLAGMILTFEKKYWLGLAVTTLGTYMLIGANHPQISYYFFLVAVCVTLAYLVNWIQKKEWKHIAIAFGITVVAAVTGLMTNSLSLLTTTEYSKATMRGGKSVSIEGDKVQAANTKGLDTSYAFQYSLMKAEPLVIMMPNAFGNVTPTGRLDENSAVVKKLTGQGVPENSAVQLAGNLPSYWGGLEFSGGVPYIGIMIVLLSILGFVLLRHPLRWGLLAAAVLGIVMSWGKFFPGFNVFLFEHLPLYNKFRAPSMSLVMLELVLPVAAALTMQQLFFTDHSRETLKTNFKKVLYTLGGVAGVLAVLYIAMDYSSPIDQQILTTNFDGSGKDTIGRLIVSGLKSDRSGMFGAQVLRTLAFLILTAGLLWLYLKKILNPSRIVAVLGVVILIDLLLLDSKYLNEDLYHSKDDLQTSTAAKSAIDNQILQDKSIHYRVYNAGQDKFSSSDYRVSAFHKAIGGYHPAKLRLYQDIMERYLYGAPNPEVLNMLNTKYIIAADPQNGQQSLIPNENAYGPCWFVKSIKLVKDDAEELQAVGSTNLKDTALVQQSLASLAGQPQWDSTSTLVLSKFDNDAVEYTANCDKPQFAVFSEVYYPYGWNAYLDGKKTDYARTDYVLRGMAVPAGKHTIRFVFEPSSYKLGGTLSLTGSFLVILFVIGGLLMAWRQGKTREVRGAA
jgi:tetrahydromethanopterin S-methyltransferase subunit E